MASFDFPPDFKWGVATSSHQIEGATHVDGRGESIWDRFAATPGKIADGTNGDVACDHYNLWGTDIEKMRWLGVDSYRFSIAWSRILPTGRGPVNKPGLDFYDRLVDGLLAARIDPMVTLYHWDLPQALQDEGGWANRDTMDAFLEYTEAVTRRLGDRVSKWITHNEPWCIATLGHEEGHHAPGHFDPPEALRVAHHVLVSHGMAVERIRTNVPNAEVGIALILTPCYPATPTVGDEDAVRQFDGSFNRWYLDPLYRGRYPDDAIADRRRWGHLSSDDLPFVLPGDMEKIAVPTDFLGLNFYSRAVMKAGAEGRAAAVQMAPKEELTDMEWEVFPDGLKDILVRVHQEYQVPKIYITENGAAYPTAPDSEGRVHDDRRVEYFRLHLESCCRALEAEVPLAGYFAWSLLDNFEWAHGYEKRFGLFWVDYETQERIPKDSAHWYRDAIAAHALAHVVK